MGAVAASDLHGEGAGSAGMPLAGLVTALPPLPPVAAPAPLGPAAAAPGAVLERGWLAKGDW
jgi:hypothetical protein